MLNNRASTIVKTTVILLSFFLLASALIGCSKKETPAAASPKGDKEPIKLTIGYSGDSNFAVAMKKAITDPYQQEHPEVQVVFSKVPTLSDQNLSDNLISDIKSGNGPDLAFIDRFLIASFADQVH